MKNKGNSWHALARDVGRWWTRRDISKTKFDRDGEPYIKGRAAENGVITWTKLANDKVVFEMES